MNATDTQPTLVNTVYSYLPTFSLIESATQLASAIKPWLWDDTPDYASELLRIPVGHYKLDEGDSFSPPFPSLILSTERISQAQRTDPGNTLSISTSLLSNDPPLLIDNPSSAPAGFNAFTSQQPPTLTADTSDTSVVDSADPTIATDNSTTAPEGKRRRYRSKLSKALHDHDDTSSKIKAKSSRCSDNLREVGEVAGLLLPVALNCLKIAAAAS